MKLPEPLQRAIEEECSLFPHDALCKASDFLSSHYRQKHASSVSAFQNPAVSAAYLAVRMPATYAVIRQVLLECRKTTGFIPQTFLDLGAGPGSGSWAAVAAYPELTSITLVEKSSTMAKVGKNLSRKAEEPSLQMSTWLLQSLEEKLPDSDLVLLAYVIAEMQPSQIERIMERLWDQTSMIVVIEPGTPEGYLRILKIRDWAIQAGAHIVAPCTFTDQCPMRSPDWCHFPARVERTRMHKRLKHASLGYEDEKFSYIAFGKNSLIPPLGRIVGPVKKCKGFVQFPLCAKGKIEIQTVSKKEEHYRMARDAQWGCSWM